MSRAEELLNSLAEGEAAAGMGENEEHIIIGRDRSVYVPESLREIAVQYDHNVETVTFDCPRYWDEHDMSTMKAYVNYMRPDGKAGKCLCSDPVVDETDENIIHFGWTLTKNATMMHGTLRFLVCIKKTNAEGNEENHWNSKLNEDMHISEGLECDEIIISEYPDIITDMLTRLEKAEAVLSMAWVNATDEAINQLRESIQNVENTAMSSDATIVQQFKDGYHVAGEAKHATNAELATRAVNADNSNLLNNIGAEVSNDGVRFVRHGQAYLSISGGGSGTRRFQLMQLTSDQVSEIVNLSGCIVYHSDKAYLVEEYSGTLYITVSDSDALYEKYNQIVNISWRPCANKAVEADSVNNVSMENTETGINFYTHANVIVVPNNGTLSDVSACLILDGLSDELINSLKNNIDKQIYYGDSVYVITFMEGFSKPIITFENVETMHSDKLYGRLGERVRIYWRSATPSRVYPIRLQPDSNNACDVSETGIYIGIIKAGNSSALQSDILSIVDLDQTTYAAAPSLGPDICGRLYYDGSARKLGVYNSDTTDFTLEHVYYISAPFNIV